MILLADEEAHVRETTAEVLEVAGYKVLQARDGKEVVEMYEEYQYEIAIVILDEVTPLLGDFGVASLIRQSQLDVPVILMTGYDKEHVIDLGENKEKYSVLTKPICFDGLSQNIRKMLD